MRFLNIAARLSFAALLIAIAIGLAAGIGTRLHLWDYHVGLFRVFPLCLYAAIAAFLLGLVWAMIAMFANTGAGARYGVIGLLGAIAILWVPLHTLYLADIAHAIPPIHDISTDTEHPPAFIALRGDQTGADNSVDYDGSDRLRFDGRSYTREALQKLYYGDIKPDSQLGTTPAILFQRALTAAQRMGWAIVAVAPDKQGGRIEATDTSLLFGLTDDIVIRVKPAGIGVRLDIRSKSRVGQSDYGRNADRIRAYLKKLAAT